MTIIPDNGILRVMQRCRLLDKHYEASFPDNNEGMHDAIEWASQICLGWHISQDAEFTAKVTSHAAA
ncbi:hypothetical protein B1H58_15300 [Pantoea alhagi]|uniref:Phage protein n=1 Tax=Pantoea alhagi TaxID=1891675 RepID=A0A1W6B883_9GAMM|nr:DUF5444 family protein [Pantoea alhagi]ARJ43264.1 hypothetical protein B1H58_15300 [Pantoea alhagi]